MEKHNYRGRQITLKTGKVDNEWMCTYKIIKSSEPSSSGFTAITSGWFTEKIAKEEALKKAKEWIDRL